MKKKKTEIEIHQLRVSGVTLPDKHPEGPSSVEVFAYLIIDRGKKILIDTGVGINSQEINQYYRPIDYGLVKLLSRFGLETTDIDLVINSHLHFDHCGNNNLFPKIPIVVNEIELESAENPDYTITDWVNFNGAVYKPVSSPSFVSQHVEVVPTPGHTEGHLSVIVNQPGGSADIVAAQAAYTADEFNRFPDSGEITAVGNWSDAEAVRSLNLLHARNPARVYFSHDSTVYAMKQ